MIMKKVLILILTCFAFFACDDYLDVKPKSRIEASDLFSTVDGFQDALTGCYLNMTTPQTYGKDLSWKLLEFMGHTYSATSSSGTEYDLIQKFEWDNSIIRPIFEDIWLGQYNTIANVNKLLSALDENKSVISEEEYQMFKGEALAIRAYCYLDILRLFGHNTFKNQDNLQNLAAPFVEKYSKELTQQDTYENVYEILISDLDDAIEYLKYDSYYPFEIERDESYKVISNNVFWSGTSSFSRKMRFNYVAVCALKARALMWKGDVAEANTAAQFAIKAIEAAETKGFFKFSKNNSYLSKTDDLTNVGEILCGLHIQSLETYMENAYETHINGTWNPVELRISNDVINEIYDITGSGEGLSDVRAINQIIDHPSEDDFSYCIKLRTYDRDRDYLHYDNRVPLVRLAESYLIYAECQLLIGEKAEAIKTMNFLKEIKKIQPDFYLEDDLEIEKVDEAIIKEYRKEFIQEGQLWYLYKRRYLNKLPNSGVEFDPEATYVIPYPQSEIEIGKRK